MFNIEEAKTAAESPWSNGVCERQNAILKESVRKTIDESGCKLETAVVSGVSAKNSLSGHQGYSPNTLVFGRNPNYPNVLTNNPPALETEVSSITVAENLKAMNNARNAFIQAECSEKIKRALRQKIRSCNNSFFKNGDKVYYKQNNNPKWKGPVCVTGQEGKSVLVKHGSEYVRVHPASLVHADKANPTTKSEGSEPIPIVEKCELTPTVEEEEEISEQDYSVVDEGEKRTNTASDKQMDVHTELALDSSIQNDKIKSLENMTPLTGQVTLPTIKSRIIYKLNPGDDFQEGMVHSRAGKATGKYKYHLNIEDTSTGNTKDFDFSSEIAEWYPVTEVMVASCDLTSVAVAKQKEIQIWQQNNVYTEVPNEGQHVISSRWVIKTKKVDGHDITKARLATRGFEDDKIQHRQTDSPTCSKESQRITLALIAASQWECKSMVIKTAFLPGKLLEREIFLKPPKEANTKKLWKLGKCVYGLNEASRYWYERVKEEFLKVGTEK